MSLICHIGRERVNRVEDTQIYCVCACGLVELVSASVPVNACICVCVCVCLRRGEGLFVCLHACW
jgi:hypothetical protein